MSLTFTNLKQQTEKVAFEEDLKGVREQAVWVSGEHSGRGNKSRAPGATGCLMALRTDKADRERGQRGGKQTVQGILGHYRNLDFELTGLSEVYV